HRPPRDRHEAASRIRDPRPPAERSPRRCRQPGPPGPRPGNCRSATAQVNAAAGSQAKPVMDGSRVPQFETRTGGRTGTDNDAKSAMLLGCRESILVGEVVTYEYGQGTCKTLLGHEDMHRSGLVHSGLDELHHAFAVLQ